MADEVLDAVVIGAGPAGLSLALGLRRTRFSRFVVVDAPGAETRDHVLAWWAMRLGLLDPLARRRWTYGALRDAKHDVVQPLAPYGYLAMDGATLRERVRAILADHGVEIVEARVDGVAEDGDVATVHAGDRSWRARWVFDSRFDAARHPIPPDRVRLVQTFSGFTVRVDRDLFEPEVATLMDFRVPQEGAFRFVYVLPWSRREALVEGVSMGPRPSPPSVQRYIRETLGLDAAEITPSEGGMTLLTDAPYARRVGRRGLRIGLAGGRLKPSSGYAFTRIVQDAGAIVRSLERHGHPFDLPTGGAIWRFLDVLMLRVLARRPDLGPGIFVGMFVRNGPARVLRFLDERASAWDVVRLGFSLPVVPFLGEALREVAREARRAAWRLRARLLARTDRIVGWLQRRRSGYAAGVATSHREEP